MTFSGQQTLLVMELCWYEGEFFYFFDPFTLISVIYHTLRVLSVMVLKTKLHTYSEILQLVQVQYKTTVAGSPKIRSVEEYHNVASNTKRACFTPLISRIKCVANGVV